MSPDYFRTAGTRIVAGREYTWSDLEALRPVAIVSRNLAVELWGSPAAALGQRVRPDPDASWRQVIGVEDVREDGAHRPPPAAMNPVDPLTYVAVTVLLSLATLLASYLPARRASNLDPVVALRAE